MAGQSAWGFWPFNQTGYRLRLGPGGGVGASLAGDIVSRAVGHAGSHQGQADADVDGAIAAQQFHGDLPLIVIHGHDAGEFPFAGADEESVARPRASTFEPPRLSLPYR